jgi:hypothetical protein
MQPVTEEELRQLIREARAEGKKVDDLEKALSSIQRQPQPKAETKRFQTQNGTTIIQSTGPARKEDFEI